MLRKTFSDILCTMCVLLTHRSEDQRGYLLSSFYWGYAVGQIPSVLLTNYIPAKNIFALSIVLASLITILLPWAAEHSFGLCLAGRTLTGLAESAAFPAAFHMYKSWVPSSERTIMITTVMAGIYMVRISIITIEVVGSVRLSCYTSVAVRTG